MQLKSLVISDNVLTRLKKIILLITLFNSPTITAFADVYKWVGDDGNVYYSDKQPKNIECEQIRIEQRDVDKCASKAESRRRLEEAEKKADQRIEERQKKYTANYASKKAQLAKQQKCLDSRKQLELLKAKLPVYRDTKGKLHVVWKYDTYKGERKYLDDTGRTSEIKRTKKLIAAYCQYPGDSEAQSKARKQWIRSELCVAAREDLKAIKRTQVRAPEDAIKKKQQRVKLYCTDNIINAPITLDTLPTK